MVKRIHEHVLVHYHGLSPQGFVTGFSLDTPGATNKLAIFGWPSYFRSGPHV